MPFQEPFESYFKKIIKPAIEDNGLLSVRGDSLFKSTHIMEDIWTSISESSLVIAELTGKNPNVYYELGLAHACRKPAILISSNIEDVPFDLRPLRVLIYNKDDPDWGKLLHNKISQSIQETLASPTEAIPHTFREYEAPKSKNEISLSQRVSVIEGKLLDITMEKHLDVENNELEGDSVQNYKSGDTVFHRKFGKGKVIGREGTGDHARLQVNFDEYGAKWLVIAYAKLKRLDG